VDNISPLKFTQYVTPLFGQITKLQLTVTNG